MKTVSQYMSVAPHSIEPHQTLSSARAKMKQEKIRHLPVRSGGQVVGLLSERDLNLLASFREISLEKATVADAMVPDPFQVKGTEALAKVAADMAERRIGSALVMSEGGQLAGIFTYTDALRALADAKK